MSDDDRRGYPRIGVVLKVEYTRADDLLADYVTDLGEGGLFIRTDASFVRGQRIGLSISFPGLVAPIELEGLVRWRRESSKDHPHAGVGVELLFRDATERKRVRELVARIRGKVPFEDRPSASGVRSRPFRVLIVEDNHFVQDLLHYAVRKLHREMVGADELQAMAAYTAGDAWKILKNDLFDLAIVDHFLPGMTGSALVQRMRGDPRLKKIPVLVVSVGGGAVRDEAISSGADLYLDKPVMLKQLLGTLRMLLSSRAPAGKAGENGP